MIKLLLFSGLIPSLATDEVSWKRFSQMSYMLKKLCENNKFCDFVNSAKLFTHNGRVQENFYLRDKIHLNYFGNSVFTNEIAYFVNKVLQ